MVYNYLLDLYRELAHKEQDIKKLQETSSLSAEDEEVLRGRLAAMRDFSDFLHRNFDAKLPHRLRKGR